MDVLIWIVVGIGVLLTIGTAATLFGADTRPGFGGERDDRAQGGVL